MIIMNLELDNIYGFKDFKMNFAYPKKIVGSTIPNEHLPERPNFRYKKVNIVMIWKFLIILYMERIAE